MYKLGALFLAITLLISVGFSLSPSVQKLNTDITNWTEKYNIENVNVTISKKDTAVLTISNRWDIIKISEFCKNVEYLERKWDKILKYNPTTTQKRGKTYEDYILRLKSEGITSIQDAKKKNKHPERYAKRFNISLEQIAKDLNTNKIEDGNKIF